MRSYKNWVTLRLVENQLIERSVIHGNATKEALVKQKKQGPDSPGVSVRVPAQGGEASPGGRVFGQTGGRAVRHQRLQCLPVGQAVSGAWRTGLVEPAAQTIRIEGAGCRHPKHRRPEKGESGLQHQAHQRCPQAVLPDQSQPLHGPTHPAR